MLQLLLLLLFVVAAGGDGGSDSFGRKRRPTGFPMTELHVIVVLVAAGRDDDVLSITGSGQYTPSKLFYQKDTGWKG